MVHLDVKQLKNPKYKVLYIHHLVKGLEALDILLNKGLIEKVPIKIDAKQEFCATKKVLLPK
jgi:hypothetical protein